MKFTLIHHKTETNSQTNRVNSQAKQLSRFSRTTPFSKRAMYSFWQNRNLGVALVNTVITAISQRAVYVGGLLKKDL